MTSHTGTCIIGQHAGTQLLTALIVVWYGTDAPTPLPVSMRQHILAENFRISFRRSRGGGVLIEVSHFDTITPPRNEK